jgi:hypothetical protein
LCPHRGTFPGIVLTLVLVLAFFPTSLHAGDAEPESIPDFLAPPLVRPGVGGVHFWFQNFPPRAEQTYLVGDFIDVAVMVDAGEIPPVGMQFVVLYDPSVLELNITEHDPHTAVFPGSITQLELFMMAVPELGQIHYAAGWLGPPPVAATYTFLRMRFRAIGPSDEDGTRITLIAPRDSEMETVAVGDDRFTLGRSLNWNVTDLTLFVVASTEN